MAATRGKPAAEEKPQTNLENTAPNESSNLTLSTTFGRPTESTDDPAEKPLLAAIAASPKDDAPRLVYADWLLERKSPGELARGELIQTQCAIATLDRKRRSSELAKRNTLQRRVNELVRDNQEEWIGLPFDERITWAFDRGFPTGRFGHAGFFIDRKRPAKSFSCMRFDFDVVVSVSIGAENSVETFRAMTKWIDKHDHRGAYNVTFFGGPALETGRKSARIWFTTANRSGRIDYEGTTTGAQIELKSHSHINEYRGSVTLYLTPVPNYDTRKPND